MAFDPTTPFVWGAGGAPMTPQAAEAQRKVAQALLMQGADYSPIKSPWQGAARVAQALVGGYESAQADASDKKLAEMQPQMLAAALTGAMPPTQPVASGTAAPMGATSIPSSNSDFVKTVMPLAQQASERTGIDPRIITAQAALETGYGKSAPGNNLFGIKSHGQTDGNVLPTTEVVDGQPVRTSASFRSYASPADSVNGYADFILANPRYQPVMAAKGLEDQAAALGQSGYATDPNYGQKVLQIARGLPVAFADTQQPADTPTAAAAPVAPAAIPATPQPVQPASMAKIAPLISLASSPYASPATKQIAGVLLSSQLSAIQKANDPMTALDRQSKTLAIEKARRDLQPIGSPYKDDDGNLVQKDASGKVNVLSAADKTPTEVGEYNFYAKQETDAGRTPLPFGQWDIARRRSGATTVDMGVIPKGYQRVQDPITGTTRLEPVPGGPADTSKQDQAKLDAQTISGNVVINAARQARDAINAAGLPAAGSGTSVLSNMGETNAAELRRQIDVLKANASIETLNQMRQQSKTGGALGSVTEGEERLLAAKSGAIDPSAPKDKVISAINDYERTLLETVHGKAAGDKIFEATRKNSQPAPTQGVVDGQTAINPKTGERLIRQNGKWVPFT